MIRRRDVELIKQRQTSKSERNRQRLAKEGTARCEKFIDPATTPDQFPFITK